MAILYCRCGHLIDYGVIPCPEEWLFVADDVFDRFSGATDVDEIYRAMRSFLKCPACGRLWVFWDGFSQPPEEYVAANPAPAHGGDPKRSGPDAPR